MTHWGKMYKMFVDLPFSFFFTSKRVLIFPQFSLFFVKSCWSKKSNLPDAIKCWLHLRLVIPCINLIVILQSFCHWNVHESFFGRLSFLFNVSNTSTIAEIPSLLNWKSDCLRNNTDFQLNASLFFAQAQKQTNEKNKH